MLKPRTNSQILLLIDARRHLLFCARRQRAAQIVKLNAAIAAMIQIRAENALQKTKKASVHLIDMVARGQPRQAIGAAPRAARIITQIDRVPARLGLARLALAALVHGHVQQPFSKAAVYTPQLFPACRAIHHRVPFYTPVAPVTQLARQCNLDFRLRISPTYFLCLTGLRCMVRASTT